MKYKTIWFCIECDHKLTDHERMYSHGRCPYCGFKHKDACTIVKTREEAKRIEEKKWYQF